MNAVFYNHDGTEPPHLLGNAAEDDYTGFPKIQLLKEAPNDDP
jgi:hypothetical protein